MVSRRWCTRSSAILLAAQLVVCAPAAFASTTGASDLSPAGSPTAASLDSALAIVSVGSIKGLIDSAGALASQVAPQMNSVTMKGMLGGMLGDPELSGLPGGAAVVVLPGGGMVGFLEVSDAKATSFTEMATMRNMKAAVEDGVLVVTPQELLLGAGRKMAGKVKSEFLGKAGGGKVHARIALSRILEQYDPTIRKGIDALPEMMLRDMASRKSVTGIMPTTATARLLQAELLFFYRVAKRIDTVTVDVEPSAKGLRIAKTMIPVAATDKPEAKLPAVESIRKLVPGKGAIRVAAVFNGKAMYEFFAGEVTEIVKDLKIEDVNSPKFAGWLKKWGEVMGDGFCCDMMLPGNTLYSGCMIMQVRDEKAALACLQSMEADLKEFGFEKMYADMGFPMSFKFTEAIREAKGVPIHQLKIEIDFDHMPGEMGALMKAVMGKPVWDVAIVNKHLIYAMEGESIEKLIDGVKSGANPESTPLVAESVCGSGAQAYVDYNIGRVVSLMAKVIPAEAGKASGRAAMEKIAASLADAPPVSWSMRSVDGKISADAFIPAGLITSFGAGVKDAAESAKPEMVK